MFLCCALAPAQDSNLPPSPQRGTAFQVSTLDALSSGIFQGAITLDDLRTRGDFGLGTFDGLDGEMVMLNRRFYQIRSDGSVVEPWGGLTTPFAVVTQFEPQEFITVKQPTTYSQLISLVEPLLPSLNYFYAIKVEGYFRAVTARSVSKQDPPYPPLASAVAQQTLFPLKDLRGTLVGFRSPQFEKGVNQPGFHFHFLREDLRAGGHALDFELIGGTIEIAILRQHTTLFPDTPAFRSAALPLP